MKKISKTFICFSAAILSLCLSSGNVYAYNGAENIVNIQNSLSDSQFDFSNYSKESIENYVEYLQKLSEKDPDYNFFLVEAQLALNFYNYSDENENKRPAYILKDRVEFNHDNEDLNEYKKFINQAEEDIAYYEKQERIKNFREEQIIWADTFLSIFTGDVNWSERKTDINSINIYEFFKDGQYCSPIDNQSLDLISTNYIENHYGIDINLNEGDNVYSIGNNAKVTASKNEIKLTFETGTDVIYKNIKSDLKTGDIVNKHDVIGTYRQIDYDYNGLFITIIKDDMEYACNWLLTEYPFITNEGMSMPLFLQGDSLWGNLSYGSTTIGPAGCGPSALSMAISYLKNQIITPADIVTKVGGENTSYYCDGQGSYWSLIDECPSLYGLKSTRISTNQVIDELKKGNPIIAIMGPGQFTNGGHFITLSGIDENGKIYVNDSADNFSKQHFNKTFSLTSIASECSCFWAISK